MTGWQQETLIPVSFKNKTGWQAADAHFYITTHDNVKPFSRRTRQTWLAINKIHLKTNKKVLPF